MFCLKLDETHLSEKYFCFDKLKKVPPEVLFCWKFFNQLENIAQITVSSVCFNVMD